MLFYQTIRIEEHRASSVISWFLFAKDRLVDGEAPLLAKVSESIYRQEITFYKDQIHYTEVYEVFAFLNDRILDATARAHENSFRQTLEAL